MAARRGPVGRRRAPMLVSSALPAPRTPHLSSTRRDLEAETPFRTFSPNPAQRTLMRVGRMIPAGRYARKMARPLRSLLRRLSRTPIDVTVLGEQCMRLHPRGNACETRILILPHLFDRYELRVLSLSLNPRAVFIDISANVGIYAIYAAIHAGPGAHITFTWRARDVSKEWGTRWLVDLAPHPRLRRRSR